MSAKVPIDFHWHHGGKDVKITGSFDNWSKPVTMQRVQKTQDEFEVTLLLDPHERVLFKFIVDGVWRCALAYGTVTDDKGNVNNVRHPVYEDQWSYLKNVKQVPLQDVKVSKDALRRSSQDVLDSQRASPTRKSQELIDGALNKNSVTTQSKESLAKKSQEGLNNKTVASKKSQDLTPKPQQQKNAKAK